ncbi:MAG: hypothetical protein R3Y15_00940 [Rikenellaceae bacterium]
MGKIEQVKTYQGRDLETIFFRPMLSGVDAETLGVKVLYNMPVPTNLHFWKRSGDILQKFSSSGWSGSDGSSKYQKTIDLSRVKAEMSYSAEDYFSRVYELIAASPEVNFEDLSGTELEVAETALFKDSIAESIRATMWLGDTTRDEGELSSFDGFLKRLTADVGTDSDSVTQLTYDMTSSSLSAEALFKSLWDSAALELKESKSQGELVFLVTSDIYANYENELDSATLEAAYLAKQAGRESLSYRGIPVVDVCLGSYLEDYEDMPQSFAILTDKRNLALAVNTASFPGTEIRMWYNPDVMENRQRAVFMAGCDYLLPELVVMAVHEDAEEDI